MAQELTDTSDGCKAAISLVREMLDNLKHCSLNSGCCHCGDSMDRHGHPMSSGHTPVDMGWSAADAWIEKAEALSELVAGLQKINYRAWAHNAVQFIRKKGLESEFTDWCGGWPCPIETKLID